MTSLIPRISLACIARASSPRCGFRAKLRKVRDLVRCRTTFQREIVKSRHYLLKFSLVAGSCSGRANIVRGHITSGYKCWRGKPRLWRMRIAPSFASICAARVQSAAPHRTGSSDRSVGPNAGVRSRGRPASVLSWDQDARRDGSRNRNRRLAPLRDTRATSQPTSRWCRGKTRAAGACHL